MIRTDCAFVIVYRWKLLFELNDVCLSRENWFVNKYNFNIYLVTWLKNNSCTGQSSRFNRVWPAQFVDQYSGDYSFITNVRVSSVPVGYHFYIFHSRQPVLSGTYRIHIGRSFINTDIQLRPNSWTNKSRQIMMNWLRFERIFELDWPLR